MRDGDNDYVRLIVPEYNLKREFRNATAPMSFVDPREAIGIDFDRSDCNVNCDKKVARSRCTAIRVPVSGFGKFSNRFWVKVNLHRERHA